MNDTVCLDAVKKDNRGNRALSVIAGILFAFVAVNLAFSVVWSIIATVFNYVFQLTVYGTDVDFIILGIINCLPSWIRSFVSIALYGLLSILCFRNRKSRWLIVPIIGLLILRVVSVLLGLIKLILSGISCFDSRELSLGDILVLSNRGTVIGLISSLGSLLPLVLLFVLVLQNVKGRSSKWTKWICFFPAILFLANGLISYFADGLYAWLVDVFLYYGYNRHTYAGPLFATLGQIYQVAYCIPIIGEPICELIDPIGELFDELRDEVFGIYFVIENVYGLITSVIDNIKHLSLPMLFLGLWVTSKPKKVPTEQEQEPCEEDSECLEEDLPAEAEPTSEPIPEVTPVAEPAPVRASTSNANAINDIKGYKELLDMGAITQEEYDAKKKQLLES